MKRLYVSDLHLGNSKSKYKEFLKILTHEEWDELYLVGDVLDLWLKDFSYIRDTCKDFFMVLNYLMTTTGLKVTYIVGNHDHDIDLESDPIFKNINIDLSIKFEGKRLIHGHQYDYLMKKYFFLFRFFTWLYSKFNASYAVSLASKQKSGKFKPLLDDIKKTAIKEADTKILIMGHTHIPEDSIIDGVRYINLGDWITHSTYATEENGIILLKGL